MKKYVAYLICGLIAVVIGDITIGSILKHYYYRQTSGLQYRTTYSIDQTEADIVIFGTSRANHHYDTKLIENETGLSAYNTGRDGQFIFYQTALLKSLLSRHTPKQIILDFAGTFEFRQKDYDGLSSLLPYYSSHKELRDIVLMKSPFERCKLLSQIYPFNSLLTTIIVGNLKYNKTRPNNKNAYNGYVPLSGSWNNELDSIDTSAKYNIDTNKYDIFEEFITIVKQNNIPLLVVYSPVYYLYDFKYSKDICIEICKNNDITFVDYSKDVEFLNNKELFRDRTHLNYKGAQQLTLKVLNTISYDD
jgi:hypothetical protein